ncbi:putative transcription factor [Methanococcus voltae]|uniref:Transcription factor n=2 Tax=Methanococcus voltae TaxID=2188 RepID=A0ABT2ETP2_METVO|nr:multiprotein bridging factor aMBF1 [Methanococcus voltae]MBP2200612.1 putative transcription factor [Methanococcus voltae]MCS3921337.1 putative transcription factor [Methanococcus voltae PS]
MECELCGKITSELYKSKIEGVEMLLCKECAKFGKSPKTYSRYSLNNAVPVSSDRPKKAKKPMGHKKDMFDDLKVVVEDYGDVIRKARERRNITIKELALKIGMKESTLHKLERGELEPEEKYVKKLENSLGINLYEDSEGYEDTKVKKESFTLGDFVKIKRRK